MYQHEVQKPQRQILGPNSEEKRVRFIHIYRVYMYFEIDSGRITTIAMIC